MKIALTIFLSFILFVFLNFFKEGETGPGRPRLYSYIREGGFTNEGRLRNVSVQTLSQCCVECYVDIDCAIVGYDEIHGICVMHDWSFLSVAIVVSTTNVVKYYQTTCHGVPDDYRYEKTLETCVSSRRPRMTWDEAKANCTDNGAHIMYVSTQAEYNYLTSHLSAEHSGVKFWTGGSEVENGTYAWMSGEIIDSSNGGQFWMENRPVQDTGCIRLQTDQSTTLPNFELRDVTCNNTYQFHCQLDNY